MDRTILLTEDQIPKKWISIAPDLPSRPDPLLDPATREPVNPEALLPIFAKELLRQEVTEKRSIDIPEEVREAYRLWRPTPLIRATRLERLLKTPARIYYKYEGVSPTGSHKPNTAVPQAYYNMKEGVEKLTTETGAGQWGSSLAYAGTLFDLEIEVYMVRISYEQKPYRKVMMRMYGAEVIPSPSTRTEVGRRILEEFPDTPGSLGIAISEAVEQCLKDENTKYSLGSVLNHVLMHQTVTGQEAQAQLGTVDEYPDKVIGCVGGGSNFAGVAYPYIGEKLRGKAPKDTEFIAVESTACPSLSKGEYLYDHGDTGRMTPLMRMFTLGHEFIPDPIHAGGLRYHGMAPQISSLANHGIIKPRAYNQIEALEAAATFTKAEGLIPAPETAHAVKATIDEALQCKETGEAKTILTLMSGHGYFDMSAYEDYLDGKLQPYELPQPRIDETLSRLKRMYPFQ
ncbi:MAG: TrpB-like pyridoxal phosphate-dependent enzyme [Candidatus Bathyarchaeota archaeon]|nr:TrpB-like pyridoxal phosphate-dependent enzyme [Candidatus Bathyarchaeota archaeon]